MLKLNIIIVGYNEEKNIPKLLKYLKFLTQELDEYKIFYIDQESKDNSVELMKKWWAEIYVHQNKWYADPDKKWAIETLCKDDEWCFVLDCDEEVTKDLGYEICKAISSGKYDIYNINVQIQGLWWVINNCLQKRLFKKSAMTVTEEIHNYLQANSDKIWTIKSKLINNDKKERWHELKTMEDNLDNVEPELKTLLEEYLKINGNRVEEKNSFRIIKKGKI